MRHALPQVAVLLAGGRSSRMLGRDKALELIGGERMIDRVLRRLAGQVQQVILSAPHDYGTGLAALADLPDGPAGPVGAIRAAALHLAQQGIATFVTAPVDAPFVPDDLVSRLAAAGPVAMAQADGAWQPAFAMWHGPSVLDALRPETCSEKWSLRRLGDTLGAHHVVFCEPGVLLNVNTPGELELARQRIGADGGKPGAE